MSDEEQGGTHFEDAPLQGHPSTLARICVCADLLPFCSAFILFFHCSNQASVLPLAEKAAGGVMFVFETHTHTLTHPPCLLRSMAAWTVLLSLWPL